MIRSDLDIGQTESSKELARMNQILYRYLCITTLFTAYRALADVVPYLAPRSQGINGARELVGWQSQINKRDQCCNYGSISITPECSRTFWGDHITQALFADALVTTTGGCHSSYDWHCSSTASCCGNTLLIQGSQVGDRDALALMADNFYLPTDYSSKVTFRPRVENFLVDFNFYKGLDGWVEGMYFRVHTPLTYTKWDLNYCEEIVSPGILPTDPGYISNTFVVTDVDDSEVIYGLSRDQLVASFSEYISKDESIENVPGVTYNPLTKARFASCAKHKVGLAEITAAWGWNFVRRENFLFGLNIRAAAPTGNRPHGHYIFEPIVGNGKHWELGGGLNSWWVWWKSCDEDRNFTVYLDAYATHMFKTRQYRTFDLIDKPLSRYMLATQFTTEVENLTTGSDLSVSTPPSAQCNNLFTPAANITTIPVDVSYAAQGELILKFAYTRCNFQFDLGYDFWGRTCAKIKKRCDCSCSPFTDNVWGLKGDAFMYGFPYFDMEIFDSSTPLSATESQATIFSGTNNYPDGTDDYFFDQNPGVDNALTNGIPNYAFSGRALGTEEVSDVDWWPVLSSTPPVLLTSDDIDTCSAQTKAYSNKLFAHVGYTWKDCECWVPYLGIGGEVEFGSYDKSCGTTSSCHISCHTNSTSCHSSECACKKFALSQWGIWAKGGFSFN